MIETLTNPVPYWMFLAVGLTAIALCVLNLYLFYLLAKKQTAQPGE